MTSSELIQKLQALGVNHVDCCIFLYVYTRMAFKDLHVNYAKTQIHLAVTAMKVSVTRCSILRALIISLTIFCLFSFLAVFKIFKERYLV